MKRSSIVDRHEPFIAAAVLTAHGLNLQRGFRQVEARWYLDQFIHWIELIEDRASIQIQNTQVARYLSELIKEGYARELADDRYPLYRLTRPGLLEITSRLVGRPYYERREHFFFVYFFIKTYRRRLTQMVQAEGKYFPYALQMQLNALLDSDVLLEDQIGHLRREITKLDKRLREQKETLETAERLLRSKKKYEDVVAELDRKYPFSLDPQRRYSELYKKGTERQRAWELTLGTASRLGYLWLPARRMLQHYLDELLILKSAGETSIASLTAAFDLAVARNPEI